MDIFAWLAAHSKVAIVLGSLWLYVSLGMTLQMWIVHRKAKFTKKLFWSIILIFPLFGRLAYGAGFNVPEADPCPDSGEHVSGTGSGVTHL